MPANSEKAREDIFGYGLWSEGAHIIIMQTKIWEVILKWF